MRSRLSFVLFALLCIALIASIALVGCAPQDGDDEATPIEIPGEDVTGDEATPIEIPGEDVTGDEQSEEEEEDEVQPATPIEIPGDEVTDE
jgi:hypothetical protein